MTPFLNALNQALAVFILQTQTNMHFLLLLTFIFFSAFILTRIFPFLLALGIWPRKIYGLPGIFFAPVLHGNFNHLFFNMIPLIVLSNFILIAGFHYYITVTIYITLISGFAIWCFGKSGIHIGASALITGYWGLLVSNSYLHVSVMSVILAVVCLYYFFGIFLGIFPREKGISWEGHLFGLAAGILVSHWG